jgi:hypothetical protein
LSNHPPGSEKRNPGALAGATGADSKAGKLHPEPYPSNPRNAISKYAADRHKRAARMLGYALTIGQPDTWHGLGFVWGERLTTAELASIAFVALRALDPDDREQTFRAAQWGAIT